MRSLGLQLARQQASRAPHYDDLEADKARNQRARWSQARGTD